MLPAVAKTANAIFTPAIGTARRVFMGEIAPGVAIGAVVLSHRTPLALAYIWAPFAPDLLACIGLLQSLPFRTDLQWHAQIPRPARAFSLLRSKSAMPAAEWKIASTSSAPGAWSRPSGCMISA